jgi:hypothetical protein
MSIDTREGGEVVGYHRNGPAPPLTPNAHINQLWNVRHPVTRISTSIGQPLLRENHT